MVEPTLDPSRGEKSFFGGGLLHRVDIVEDGDAGEPLKFLKVFTNLQNDTFGISDGFGALEAKGDLFEVEGSYARDKRIFRSQHTTGESVAKG